MSLLVNIRKVLGDFELKVNFEAKNSQVFAILGSSGCGKSMTLKCVAGIEKPDDGEIILNGKVLFDCKKKINIPSQHRKIGYLFQNYALFPNMTVEQNIAFGINAQKGEKQRELMKIVADFKLLGQEKKLPWQLSGGQQQRVALARIFASKPEVLMLDEPFSALDSNLQWKMEEEMRERLRNYLGNVLFVSHRRDEVYRLADQVAMLDNGFMQKSCDAKQLFGKPQTLSALLLTGCKNISRAKKISKNQFRALDWGMTLTSEDYISDNLKHVGIRGINIQIHDEPIETNCFQCKIEHAVEDISEYVILFAIMQNEQIVKEGLYCKVSKREYERIKKQKDLYISLPSKNLILLEE